MLRQMLDKVEPLFHKGGPLEKLYPLYEANDTFLYTPGEVAHGKTHIRDAIDTKRMMSMVILALLPCIFMACYNTGYQAQKTIALTGYTPPIHDVGEMIWSGSWRYAALEAIGVNVAGLEGGFLSPQNILPCFIHGLLFFLPVYIVCMAVGGTCELIFSVIRGHEINEGFLVTGMLFPLTLPATIPLWQVAVGIAFGVVIGKEIFGGTGKNFLNPALTARAFLYFAYPKQISGDKVWTAVGTFGETATSDAVDGYSGATMLGYVANAKEGTVSEVITQMGVDTTSATDWWSCFIGNIHGSMGETSTLACLIGAVILIATGVGSWRTMAGVVGGMVAFSGLLAMLGFDSPIMNLGPQWHLVIGGFAFGTVFMSTDPVSSAMTNSGRIYYGVLIGFLTILVRAINPAFPEGIMLAILFANVFAPLIDWFVVQRNIKRREARYAT
ncbi:NADH:ubiquinone reductase (Na(+)-transporting) subunit B [Mariniblastus fucicola]|uniref:Na(+)-translocating NADH-quinone reductase subunit B n=1 Tax=Mariniblastus fucicola TaxID=980251 RepID=A0A5B9PGU1_9BACT|nr:NADH:ubiquinone reductase (Na(+)-transporting) subunit B [Mariniblastus fucicola]QEG22131.1 Na(+)-translocating NADH-quinone reductase subunit B [Mariniblastus fucicola]